MRYYSLVLNTTAKKIEEGAKIKLNEYEYHNPIGAMNCYMYRNLKNGIIFFAYREEENAVPAVFAFDEKTAAFGEAYDHILGNLSSVFSVKQIKSEPVEITIFQCYEHYLEVRRRCYVHIGYKLVDSLNMELYDGYYNNNEQITLKYSLEEKIISEKRKSENPMYDASVLNELSNIESHQNISDFNANMVHYFISSKSREAANDITEALVWKLAQANRISGRRMEIISEIRPDIFSGRNFIEDIIENNYGGVMVMDLSCKLQYESTEYGMACKYIEGLVKRYKNDCLFVFTYNSDDPGFAYELLSAVSKCIIPVKLKEGSGDRKAAVKFLKELIKASEHAKYAGQAGEFLKLFPGDEFTQTEVLAAFEQFGAWSFNKNILKAYDFVSPDGFMLDRDDNHDSSYEKLNKMIGLTSVKEQIDNIIAADIVEKERKKRKGKNYESGTMHMIFSGNPGTAKTTVAKLFAGIAKEKGILKSGAFVERGGMDLNGMACVYAIRQAFKKAEGGVLFIDEAYSLRSDTAVTVLIQEMENHRDSVIVILAGYNGRMNEFLERNEGLKSRTPHRIEFPDYTDDELTEIFKKMMNDRGFEASEGAIAKARSIFERARYMDNFGNGRFARNLLDRAVTDQSVRLLNAKKIAEKIPKNELFFIKEEDISKPGEDIQCDRAPGTAQKELDEMIGLASVKTILKKVVANFKLKKLCMDKGIRKGNPALHMVFSGDPGTAKTTVARLFAEIMRDEKILPSGNFVEAGRADLISDHVGGTAPLVKRKFKEAQGGVLFIDEAYSLCDYHENSFGDEAINTLVQEMENHRDDVIVIFAGYSDKMKSFLDRNPGMASRIAFHVDFENYTVEELCDITRLQLSNRNMTITDSAMTKLEGIYEKARENRGFGNGRFVRKMLEEAEMNLAERVSRLNMSDITEALITTVEERDIPEFHEEKSQTERRRVGF